MIKSLATAAATVTALTAGVMTPAPAMADGAGCTAIGLKRVCVNVEASGGHVDRVRTIVDAPIDGAHNFVLRTTFFDANRKQIEQHISPLYEGTARKQEFTIHPNKDYPAGRVCASITENGVESPGACASISA